jgi:hypothetical protein
METQQLSQIVMSVLEEYAKRSDPSNGIEAKTVFDTQHHRYQLIKHGWQGTKRYFYNVVYIDIKNNLIWVQDDNTEIGVANLLLEQGVTKDLIVLGFQPPAYRKYTEFNPSV